jgi:cell division septum initiation protein DivIVA
MTLQLAVALLLLLFLASQAFLPGTTRLAHSAQSRLTKSAQQPTPASATTPAPAVAAKKAEGVEPGGGPLDISLKDKLLFIESLLVPAFDPDNKKETPKERKKWMKKEANKTNWDAGVSAELIKRYGTVNSLEKAERLLEEVKAERLLEKAEEKAERALEKAEEKEKRSLEKARENEIGRGTSSIICSSSSLSCLLLSCMISCS